MPALFDLITDILIPPPPGAEMQKVADAADLSVLFSAGANFWAVLGHFWAILANFE